VEGRARAVVPRQAEGAHQHRGHLPAGDPVVGTERPVRVRLDDARAGQRGDGRAVGAAGRGHRLDGRGVGSAGQDVGEDGADGGGLR
jgi:hypothetical protein